jgi:hypothetical protein
MSNLISDFKRNKLTSINNSYNKTIFLLNNNYNIEIRYINRLRINIRLKQSAINNIDAKYKQLINNVKLFFENEIKRSNIISEPSPIQFTLQSNKKKALIIGINYLGTSSELNGCINDANSIESYLKEQNFTNIKMLTDETSTTPTRENILYEIKKLLETSNENDTLFIYYSGHGSNTLDKNGDESDGYDELIVPLDFNFIKDDEIKTIINTYGKSNTNLIALFDSCNSGTALDLKYQILEKVNYDDISENTKTTETNCNAFLLSGCRDEQVSLETLINNKTQGLMTWSFLETVRNNKPLTWRNLVKKMREILKPQSNQIPQLSSGRLFNPDSNFIL